ncbi:MinD/ParA family protein [Proteiniclasticum sp. C24MP]|uniref:MinD/ParA family protein n=1 Tax=Proteiniclasticum sp. C24MP TaxID=3374101 RepID=UPI0037541B6A
MNDQAESLRKRMMASKRYKRNRAEEKASTPPMEEEKMQDIMEAQEEKHMETGKPADEESTVVSMEVLTEATEEEAERIPDGLVKIYAVVSGKGGVGKTNVSVNLSIAMADKGKKVLLMDADIGMTNADILMGIHYEHDLFDYLEGRVKLAEIIYEGPRGIKVISGGAGLLEMNLLDEKAQKTLIKDLIELGGFDVMVIDNGAGISRETLSFITFAHEVILVTTPEPTAITDAYRVLKTISHYELKSTVKLIVNKVSSKEHAEEAFEKLESTCKAFLSLELENCGYIFDDSRVEKAIMKQEPVILSYPNALSSGNIHDIAGIILDETVFISNISTIKQLGNRFMKIFGT